MIALALALATASAAPSSPEEACNDHDLQVMMSSQPDKRSTHMQELDKRVAFVLHEERAVEATLAPGKLAWATDKAVPGVLGLVGLLLALVAAGKKSRAMALVGVICVGAAGALAMRAVDRERVTRARVGELKDCRFRVEEARATLEHSEFARCLHDLTEVDEDLMVIESKVKAGAPSPTILPDVQKIRGELAHR